MTPTKTTAPLSYVLITPARNEAQFIELTLRSVAAQTVKPLRWVIVNDGSTDNTAEIIAPYLAEHDWIELLNLPIRQTRDFGAKVRAFNEGYARMNGLDHFAIGSLDADISFESGYFSFLLSRLSGDQAFGIVGTPFVEAGRTYDYRFTSAEHVSGACQLFRRQCFEDIGGYVPTSVGGIDLIAVLSARMKGWKTRSFPEQTCIHHRNMGRGKHGRLLTAFNGGRGDFVLGTHPLWELCRTPYQMTRAPYLLAGLLRLTGYSWAALTHVQKEVSGDLLNFRRDEQMKRLRTFFAQLLPGTTTNAC